MILVLKILLAHFLAVASPGPDFIVVLRNTLTYSRKAGIFTSLGIGTGIIIHVVYTFLGIGLIIKESPALFEIIKYIGTAYILYIAYQSFFSKSNSKIISENKKENISTLKAFRIGFFTNVFNPKVSLFFLSLFTVILEPNTSVSLLVFLAFMIVFSTVLWFVLVSFIFTKEKIQKKYYLYQNSINKVFGILLFLFALQLIFTQ